MPPGQPAPKFECPHCGKSLTRHTINIHLAKEADAFEVQSSDSDGPGGLNNNGNVNIKLADAAEIIDNNDKGPDNDNSGDVAVAFGLEHQELAHNQDEINPGLADDFNADPLADGVDHPGDIGADPLPNPAHIGADDPLLAAVYRILHNPPVALEAWDDPADSDASNDDSSSDDEGSAHSDEVPLFDEQAAEPGLDPDDEPYIDPDVLRDFLEEYLVFLDDDAWEDLQDRELNQRDRKMLELLATRLRIHMSRTAWNDIRLGVCAEYGIGSEFIAWRRLRILSGLATHKYDCCINSCVCYVGKYAEANACPFCREPRYNSRRKPRRVFVYTPLAPQLRALFQSSSMAAKLRYRAEADRDAEPGVIHDVFDGQDYRRLCATPVNAAGGYRFFENPEDIALGLSTDGFTLFKRRRRGLSTAWPIILINYNLHPRYRTKLENVVCVGVIPGPTQCKDINSFLAPLLDELLELEAGVVCSGVDPDGVAYVFLLHAFLILVFGDILAVSKMMSMKGHNGVTPCRACYMQGYPYQRGQKIIYYIPLRRPDYPIPFSPYELPMRSQAEFLQDLEQIEAARTRVAREELMMDLGINARSIFAHLKSIDLSSSFPFDIMHLLFENLVPNMIKHWTGKFKWLDQGDGRYEIDAQVWKVLGGQTAAATRTIPAQFVGTLPNIAEDPNLFKAEGHSFWFQYIAPVLLRDVLNPICYNHFLKMREIIMLVLKFSITEAEVDELQTKVGEWVVEYEVLYYQHTAERLPACPLTIHALLHMAYYIRRTGPLWASWAFVMERYCQHILLCVKNRVRPYEMINNQVERDAQMRSVARTFGLPLLGKPRVHLRVVHGVEISGYETLHDEFRETVLGTPVKRRHVLTTQLENQLLGYFSLVYPRKTRQQLKHRIDFNSLISYGRFRMVPDGDRIRTAGLIENSSIARDNSFVKYDLLPDRNARYQNRRDRPYRRTYYGQCVGIYFVRFTNDDNIPEAYLLAAVRQCDTDGSDAVVPETPVVTYGELGPINLVHIDTIIAVVGRVQLGERWAVVDRSRENVRPVFDDEAEDEDENENE